MVDGDFDVKAYNARFLELFEVAYHIVLDVLEAILDANDLLGLFLGGFRLLDADDFLNRRNLLAFLLNNHALGDDNDVADKCDFCSHRLEAGMEPACVETCPAEVFHFGDANDPDSPYSRFMANNAAKPAV